METAEKVWRAEVAALEMCRSGPSHAKGKTTPGCGTRGSPLTVVVGMQWALRLKNGSGVHPELCDAVTLRGSHRSHPRAHSARQLTGTAPRGGKGLLSGKAQGH